VKKSRALSFRTTFSVLMYRYRSFKNVNGGNTYGQQLATSFKNRVLRGCATAFTETDVIARYGGKELWFDCRAVSYTRPDEAKGGKDSSKKWALRIIRDRLGSLQARSVGHRAFSPGTETDRSGTALPDRALMPP